ncbi:MAG: type II toxin-antitoxin system HicA family toxin [Deltaproteobacteria bacterium]|nr:type II toxin-antitoxin system HicA family toxin [Deltaproteobacteria bacterium]
MSSWNRFFEEVRRNRKNVRFADLCRLAERFGFRLHGSKGSHRVYTRVGVFEILNFQDVHGMAKPYQVRQFLNIVEKYHLELEDE